MRAIERELGKQLGLPVAARCASILGLPSSCVAILPDRSELPVRVELVDGHWDLTARTPVITTAPIVAYVTGELADLGITDLAVRCGAPIRVAAMPTTIECTLGDGGARAFVAIDADGSVADVELALDRGVADARGSAQPGADLDQLSRALAHLADDDDGDK